jgi:hypothetical protein
MVYACYFPPETASSWYVCEGQPEGEDCLLLGFASFPDADFRRFPLSELQAIRGPLGQTVKRAPTFTEGRFTDAVRSGRTSIAITAVDRADRAVRIMNAEGAVYLEERVAEPAARAAHSAAQFADPGFYPRRQAAQVFEVS